jgi:non-ribosomal peptide synthase protein (TIGR01720 family)
MDSDYETLEARVAALSEDQRRWLARKLEASAPRASTAEPKPPARGLVAYYAPGEGARIETDTLRAFLADRLPDYMIPATFMALERLPRTEGGKLDRDALPVPIEEHARPESIESGTPRNEIEETLVRIWQEVLGVEEVSIHDDFLEIGGDSLLSIRVLARARRVDIEISPEVFFEKPTIAALSERLDPSLASGGAEAGRPGAAPGAEDGATQKVASDAPLTPIQEWFFENIPDHPEHWNQSLLLSLGEDLDADGLREAIDALAARHVALRTRFEQTANGRRQVFEPRLDPTPIEIVTVASRDEAAMRECVLDHATRVHRGFDLGRGPLIRFVLFEPLGLEAGAGETNAQLLIGSHHLIADAASGGSLRGDLEELCRRRIAGEPLRMPAPPSDLGEFARRLGERAHEFATEADAWVSSTAPGALPIPVDHDVDAAVNQAGSAENHRFGFEAAESETLLTALPRRFGVRVQDVLLTALLQAWGDWAGTSRLCFDLEGHGRDSLADELDLSSSIGWFTTVFPVALELDAAEPEAAMRSVRRQLEATESRGASHGIVRYLGESKETAKALAEAGRPELLFNFLGRTDGVLAADSPFRISAFETGPARHPEGRRAYKIEINASVESGGLQIDIAFHPAIHDRASIALLAERWNEELRLLARLDARGDSAPTSLSGLDRSGLETVAALLERRRED